MSRLRFDVMPAEWAKAREVVDAALRTVREVLDGGWRWREQTRVLACELDTGALPLTLQAVPRRPVTVSVLSVTERRNASEQIVSGCAVLWSWRAGTLVIHSVQNLDPSTRYDAVFAVME